jgi:acetolactate synthase-1/2/3 large subunit
MRQPLGQMKIAVSELIVRFMERLGVEHVFGMPGAHILPVYDSLYGSTGIKSVLVKHEQGAAFMAGGYARATGRIGACLTTAGPGATNLVTGIANAYADKLPLLIVTGETSTWIFGKGGLQESSGEGGSLDQAALFKAITRYHRIVERTDYLPQVLNQAARTLLSANPGPVLLSFPYNIQKELVDAEILDGIAFGASGGPTTCGLSASAVELAELIAAARYPVIVAGHGCVAASAHEELAQASELLGIPVATTLKGKGVVSESSPMSLGCLGVTSDGCAYRYIVDHADLLIFLGTGFNERTSYLWDTRLLAGKKIVQVDSEPDQLEKVFRANLAVLGDARDMLGALLAVARHEAMPRKALDKLAEATGARRVADRFRPIEHLLAELAARFSGNAMIFDDNIIVAQSYLKASPGIRYFPNTGISSLGHALPAAIGARFARAAPTFAILGDGGFQMCCMELMTAVNYDLPVNVVLINNGAMGLIRKNQFQLYGGRYIDCDFRNPDYALLAQSFGIRHWKIDAEADVDAMFAKADLENEINLIEVMWDKNVFPSYLSDR